LLKVLHYRYSFYNEGWEWALENGRKWLKAHRKNTLTDQSPSNVTLLNTNFDIQHDLDLIVDIYQIQ
jgi:hypothetical protein